MAVRTRSFRSLVWTTSLKIVFFHGLIFLMIGYDFGPSQLSPLYRVLFWAVTLLLVTGYQILKLLLWIEREIGLLSSPQLDDQDQTEQIQIRELIAVYQELRSSRQEIISLLDREQGRNRDLVLQLSATSHDLKTPLTVIRGNAELLELAQLPQPQADYAAEILLASQKMADYAAALIDYAKTFQAQESDFVTLALADFVRDLQEDFALFSKGQDFHFSTQLDCAPDLALRLHPDYLRRALINILLNALQYADPDSRELSLTISCPSSSQLVFSIWNNGPAFSQEDLAAADQLFYQSELSRNSDSGHHGIGLAFAKQAANLHQGSLKVWNPPQGGAAVELAISREIFE
ncbi:sensor histidine kinase [Streptococcus panodentis]|uniref:histidine kinase n=1 Tax=Streptococcus panodentis TaxID=1581472 RepID=A0ABS5AVC8_9STRE|nr:HAMP domain-containing sensor histidine kinase [Streptococcus panodentis]MBP2620519.1 two-component sensor histidine kinase [Streptococcus panodentis]